MSNFVRLFISREFGFFLRVFLVSVGSAVACFLVFFGEGVRAGLGFRDFRFFEIREVWEGFKGFAF